MRKLLRIGEVAQLLGVTTKTIRHYHKCGLLPEPERTESGYRLYNAQALLRLKRIRHMQAFGLPLKHIKAILGDNLHQHTLREILQALDGELETQLQALQERRSRIRTLLEDESQANIDQPATLTSFEIVKELLGERLASVTPEMLEMEKQLWLILEEFDWPDDYRAHMLELARNLTARPDLYERMFSFNKKLAALSRLPEDAPEIELLVEDYLKNKELQETLAEIQLLATRMPPLEGPFAEIFGSLMATNSSPALQRFIAEVGRRSSLIQSTQKQ